jgi:hypothetical protein
MVCLGLVRVYVKFVENGIKAHVRIQGVYIKKERQKEITKNMDGWMGGWVDG